MTEKIKKTDFVELDYTGKEKDSNLVFDTTLEDIAKKNNLYSKEVVYKSVIICVGEKQILPGLDKELEGKEIGKSYSFEIPPELGFGKKDAKLLRIIPAGVFKKQEIRPFPGLQVNIDGAIGTVKTAGGGRIIVDFNHPLSGRTLIYDVNVKRIITDKKEKLKAYLDIIRIRDVEIDLAGDEAKIKLKIPLPDQIKEHLSKKLQELVELKKVDFEVEQVKEEKSLPPAPTSLPKKGKEKAYAASKEEGKEMGQKTEK